MVNLNSGQKQMVKNSGQKAVFYMGSILALSVRTDDSSATTNYSGYSAS